VDPHAIHTVLVVEDEMMVRMPIAEYLRDCGYNVLEAGNANEAIAALDAAESVSLVIYECRARWTGLDWPNGASRITRRSRSC
jgi:CheY-like chemotaxis protein